MTVPHEDVDRKVREAHSGFDELEAVVGKVRTAIDDLAAALKAARERGVS